MMLAVLDSFIPKSYIPILEKNMLSNITAYETRNLNQGKALVTWEGLLKAMHVLIEFSWLLSFSGIYLARWSRSIRLKSDMPTLFGLMYGWQIYYMYLFVKKKMCKITESYHIDSRYNILCLYEMNNWV